MSDETALVPVGRVGRPHGLDGAFVVERASDDGRRWEVGASVLVDGAPATIEDVNRLLQARKQMEKMMKAMGKGKLPTLPPELTGGGGGRTKRGRR